MINEYRAELDRLRAVSGSRRESVLREAFKDGSILITDEYKGYNRVSEDMLDAVICHSKAYADGLVHTNSIESFWAIVKRAWYGTHHHYSRKYMPLYIAEACYRYNRRKSATAFADSMRAFVGATA